MMVDNGSPLAKIQAPLLEGRCIGLAGPVRQAIGQRPARDRNSTVTPPTVNPYPAERTMALLIRSVMSNRARGGKRPPKTRRPGPRLSVKQRTETEWKCSPSPSESGLQPVTDTISYPYGAATELLRVQQVSLSLEGWW